MCEQTLLRSHSYKYESFPADKAVIEEHYSDMDLAIQYIVDLLIGKETVNQIKQSQTPITLL